ncbi:MAG: ABC transporter ATP-binding protein [Bacteroidales bacterium]|nr:ABC transporter ATP-binding protein [Bacteroidales bacterium]
MIEVKNLSYSYGKKEILRDLSFTIGDGTFTAILGANGSGKTTLLRCIAGLTAAQQGHIDIDGQAIGSYNARERARKVALVQQHPQTDLEFSAFETVLMGRNPYQRHLQNESKADWDIVEQVMRQTNTFHLRFSLPGEMSGGELQRVMIARALAQQTPYLLLDEPTSSLDIAHQFEIMELLTDINRNEGKTILIVVHDLNLALRYCPETILLYDKSLLFKGSTKEALVNERIQKAFGVSSENIGGYLKFDSANRKEC